MINAVIGDHVSATVGLLAKSERALLRHVETLSDDAQIAEVAAVLHDLCVLRMQIEERNKDDARKSMRLHEYAVVKIFSEEMKPMDGALYDISMGGAAIAVEDTPEMGALFDLILPGVDGPCIKASVRNTADGVVHFKFERLTNDQSSLLGKYITRHMARF